MWKTSITAAKLAAVTLRLVGRSRDLGGICSAGVEDGRVTALNPAPREGAWAGVAPGPLPSSTPAEQMPPRGIWSAERGVVGEGGCPHT